MIVKKIKLLVGIIGLFLIFGCGAYMNKNMNPYYFGMTIVDNQVYKKSKGVDSYKYDENSVKYFLKRGYVVKAKSAFRETYVHLSWAELAAKQLGATVMLTDRNYVGSISGRTTLAWTVPGDTYKVTSNTNGNISYNSNTNSYVYGNSGYAVGNSSTNGNVKYNSTTTTTIQGPDKLQVTSVPYQNHYYDQYAVFMVKKYYWSDKDFSYYHDKKFKDFAGSIKAGEWFELGEKSGKYRKIIYGGKSYYVNRDDKIMAY